MGSKTEVYGTYMERDGVPRLCISVEGEEGKKENHFHPLVPNAIMLKMKEAHALQEAREAECSNWQVPAPLFKVTIAAIEKIGGEYDPNVYALILDQAVEVERSIKYQAAVYTGEFVTEIRPIKLSDYNRLSNALFGSLEYTEREVREDNTQINYRLRCPRRRNAHVSDGNNPRGLVNSRYDVNSLVGSEFDRGMVPQPSAG